MELNRFSTKANISGKNFKVTPIKEESVTKTLFHQINQVFSLSPLSKHRQAPLEKKKTCFPHLFNSLNWKEPSRKNETSICFS